MLWSVLLACGPQLTNSATVVVPEEPVPPPASLVGLTPDDGALHLADLGRTEGVDAGLAISNTGLWALAGMKGYTCDVWTRDGSIHADTDYPGGGDQVIDDDDDRLLVRTNDGLFVTRFSHGNASGAVAEEFLADGRLVEGGLVTLAWEPEGCRAAWYTRTDAADDVTWLEEPWGGAGGASAAEPETGARWMLTRAELVRVTPEGVARHEVAGDLVAWDAASEQLYAASRGSHGVEVVQRDGSVDTWETLAPVTALGTLGDVGAAVVGGPDTVEVLWGEDGRSWAVLEGMMRPGGPMHASTSGAVLGWQDVGAARFLSAEIY